MGKPVIVGEKARSKKWLTTHIFLK
jgi:hypothetical protein